MEWLRHLLGADGQDFYNVWSGLGADIGQVALVGGALGLYRRHKCHVKGCWRLGKQAVDDTGWVVCHHHHPAGHATPEKIAAATSSSDGSAG